MYKYQRKAQLKMCPRSQLYHQAKALGWVPKWNKSKTADMIKFIDEQNKENQNKENQNKENQNKNDDEKYNTPNIEMTISPMIILEEYFNPKKLQWILSNKKIVENELRKNDRWSDDWNIWNQLNAYYNDLGVKEVKYNQRGNGRVFAEKAQGLQSLSREVRHTISKDYYQDLDMVNAHPVILQYLCRKNEIKTPYLDEYVSDRDKVISDIGDKTFVKTLILKLTNGGGNIKTIDNEWLKGYGQEMLRIHSLFAQFYSEDFDEYTKDKPDYNIKAKFMNIILCRFEHVLLMSIWEYFGKPKDAVLCFDGIMLNLETKIDIPHLQLHILNKHGIDMKLKIKPMDEGFDTSTKPSNKKIFAKYAPKLFNEKFCANHQPLMMAMKKGVDVALVAGTGTGKTVAAAKHAVGRGGSAGMLSFRVSLAKKYDEDFTEFKCYKNIDAKVIDTPKWICQLDSLHRIKTPVVDVLYIDEISQVRRHLNASTFMRNRHYLENMDMLKNLIRMAKQLIVMDANLTPLDLKWVYDLRGKALQVYINEAVPRKQTIEILNNEQAIIRSAKADLADNKKIVIAHNGGKKHHEPLRRMLGDPDKNILVINSLTLDEPEVKAALNNPNAVWGNYDCIIYSPSVQSGVSYDLKNVFYRVYGIFSNCTNSSGDAGQMMNRVRHPINKQTRVSITTYPSAEARTIECLLGVISSMRAHLALDIKEKDEYWGPFNDYSELEFIANKMNSDIAKANIEQNMDRLNFKTNFIWHQERYGNDVIFSSEKKTPEEDIKLKKEKAQFCRAVEIEDAEELAAAPDITEEGSKIIKKKLDENKSVSKEEVVALKKFNVNKTYKMLTPQGDKEWYLTYNNRKMKKVYNNSAKYFRGIPMTQALEELKQSEIRNDRDQRIGDSNTGKTKSTRACVLNFWLNKPRYQKERVLVEWLLLMGFDSLNSPVKLDEGILRTRLAELLSKVDRKTFDILGKRTSKLNVLKLALVDDKKLLKIGLGFINGSLRDYFGVAISKKGINDKTYILKNKNISEGLFKSPFEDRECDPSIPVLGNLGQPEIQRDEYEIMDVQGA